MKICTVSPAFNRHGGVPYVARNIVAQLDERGDDCWVITDTEKEEGVTPNLPDSVQIHSLKRTDRLFPVNIITYALRALPVLESLHKQHNFDLIHMHGNYIILPILTDILGKVDAPLVETAHGTYLNEIDSFFEYPSFDQKWKYCTGVYLDHVIQKFGTRFADHVHTVADQAKPELVRMGIDEERISVTQNGVNLEEFDEESVDSTVREQYDLEGSQVALSVGSVIPRKGVHTIVDAAAKLKRRDQDIHLVHVGGHGHRGYSEYLQNQIQERGLGNMVSLPGRVSRSELLGWFQTCDLAVSAAYSEGCPINVLEAAASRCTVVTTDIGGAPDVLGEYGIYVEPGNPSDLAEKIAYGFSEDRGDQLRKRIEQQFTWTQIVDDLRKEFLEWTA